MSDHQRAEFYGRVAGVEKAHARGDGFKAAGTLSRRDFDRHSRRRLSLPYAILFVIVAVFVFKGLMLLRLGEELYDARVAQLLAGERFEMVGGWLMQVDPVTRLVANLMHQYLPFV